MFNKIKGLKFGFYNLRLKQDVVGSIITFKGIKSINI